MRRISNDRPSVVEALDKLGIEHKGNTFRCPNPDHPDNHPSSGWYGDGTRWKCHACGAGGDACDVVEPTRVCGFAECKAFFGRGAASATRSAGNVMAAGGGGKTAAAARTIQVQADKGATARMGRRSRSWRGRRVSGRSGRTKRATTNNGGNPS